MAMVPVMTLGMNQKTCSIGSARGLSLNDPTGPQNNPQGSGGLGGGTNMKTDILEPPEGAHLQTPQNTSNRNSSRLGPTAILFTQLRLFQIHGIPVPPFCLPASGPKGVPRRHLPKYAESPESEGDRMRGGPGVCVCTSPIVKAPIWFQDDLGRKGARNDLHWDLGAIADPTS